MQNVNSAVYHYDVIASGSRKIVSKQSERAKKHGRKVTICNGIKRPRMQIQILKQSNATPHQR